MKNLRKKTGCLVMAVLLLIMTFVPAMSVTVSAAANIEGRLITVGGKTVNSGMKIAEVEKLFGKPKLTTPSYWGGYAYTFYGDKYSDYLYLETDADGVIVCYGSVSPGFETNVYNYGDKVDHYVRLGYEATDYDDNLYGVIYYTKYHSDAYERFGANLTENLICMDMTRRPVLTNNCLMSGHSLQIITARYMIIVMIPGRVPAIS